MTAYSHRGLQFHKSVQVPFKGTLARCCHSKECHRLMTCTLHILRGACTLFILWRTLFFSMSCPVPCLQFSTESPESSVPPPFN